MKFLKKIRRYYLYCGIEKDEYNELKKDAYVSNFEVWRILHFIMFVVFFGLFVASLSNEMMSVNRDYYLAFLLYSGIAIGLFSILKKDSLRLRHNFLYIFQCRVYSCLDA